MKEQSFGKKILDFYAHRYQEMAGYGVSCTCPPLKEMLEYLSALPDRPYELYGFSSEPLKGKIVSDERDRLLMRCDREGREYAERLKREFPNSSALEIAEKLGIHVTYPEIPMGGGRVLFAEFEEPRELRIYKNALRNAEKAITEYQLEELFGGISIENVLAAHELFHYMEMKDKDSIFSLNYEITLWRIGFFRYTSHLACLSEITAMSFAKTLTGIPFSPYLFDVFLSYTYDPNVGGQLYQKIRSFAEQKNE